MKHTTKIQAALIGIILAAVAYKLGIDNDISIIKSLISFLIIISIIVFIHEFGHYSIAKWAGVKIDTFSLGFGNEIFGWNDKSGTRWKVSALPFGGYVKMFGDATEASTPVDDIKEFSSEEKQKAFYYKPLYKKAAIVVAGPLFNFVLTIIILTFIFLSGGVQTTEPIVGEIMKDSPAEAAGLMHDDRIVSINGEHVVLFSDIQRLLFTNLGTPVTLIIDRGGKTVTFTLTPKQITEKDSLGSNYTHPVIGITSKTIQIENVGLGGAVVQAVRGTYNLCSTTLYVVGQVITGERSAKDTIQGPLGMAKISGKATEHGFRSTFFLMALISANLGLINLFPIPVLDGGHLLFYGIEAIMGKPPGKRFQEYCMRVGMALVMMLMAYAVLNDIRNWLVTLTPK